MTATQTKTYSISDMARACGVKPSSMRSQLLKRGLKPTSTGQNNSKRYPKAVLNEMRKYYRSKSKSSPHTSHVTQSDVIEQMQARINQLEDTNSMLKDQLKVKDEQIKSINELASATNRLVSQAQTLDASHRLSNTTNANNNDITRSSVVEDKTKTKTTKHGWLWHLTHGDDE